MLSIPRKAERRPEMISFGGMIVNDVENHFDPGRVQIAHHRFELGHLAAAIAAAGVFRFRREETDRVVTPVIRQAAIDQRLVIDVRVHRQQLDRGHAQIFEVINRAGAAEPGVSAAQFRRNARASIW